MVNLEALAHLVDPESAVGVATFGCRPEEKGVMPGVPAVSVSTEMKSPGTVALAPRLPVALL